MAGSPQNTSPQIVGWSNCQWGGACSLHGPQKERKNGKCITAASAQGTEHYSYWVAALLWLLGKIWQDKEPRFCVCSDMVNVPVSSWRWKVSFFFKKLNRVDLQCCVSFCYTAQSFSYTTHTHTHTHTCIHLLWFIMGYWIESSPPVPYSRSLLLTHSAYNILCLLTPNSLSIPRRVLFSSATTSLFSASLCLFLL